STASAARNRDPCPYRRAGPDCCLAKSRGRRSRSRKSCRPFWPLPRTINRRRNMLGRILLGAQVCLPLIGQSAPASGDVVMRAMQDELARSMKKLQLENLQKPYFVAYRAVENEGCNVTASFGALVNSYCEPPGTARSRLFSVEVRVGDYARD